MQRTFSAYVHVPFCARRCGYCDFNTYTARELGPGASQREYAHTVGQEIDLAAQYLQGENPLPAPLHTVFFGGGTPTLLPSADLVAILTRLREVFGLASGAEVTTEANPDSLAPGDLQRLAEGGFTRVSLGMQSAVPHVLQRLDRTHRQTHLERAVREAQQAGLRTSVDLIYATPGESLADWRTSVQTALDLGVEHISAYALVIEPGTALGRALRRGQVPAVQSDDEAAKYELADTLLSAAGLQWYEISNWARPGFECAHNLAYWRDQDWWGFGPGAHSHLGGPLDFSRQSLGAKSSGAQLGEALTGGGGVSSSSEAAGQRLWNVKHPRKYAQMLAAGQLPVQGGELIDPATSRFEGIMLGLRLREGLKVSQLSGPARAKLADLEKEGLLRRTAGLEGDGGLGGKKVPAEERIVLTRRGRLLADQLTLELTD